MVGNVSFRSATFGGFNRDDVMDYIEKTNKEYTDSLNDAKTEAEAAYERAQELDELNFELKNQLETQQREVTEQLIPLKAEMERLVSENAAMTQANQELSQRNEQMAAQIAQLEEALSQQRKENTTLEGKNKALSAQGDQLRDVLNRRTKSLKDAEAKIEEQNQTIAQMDEQVRSMTTDNQNYHVICGRLGKIEAEMQSRAIVVEEEAHRKAEAQLAQAKAYYNSLMNSANEDAAVICRQMEEHLEQIRTNTIVTSEDMNQCISSTLADVSNIQNMLQKLSGRLNEHVDALMALDVKVTPAKPYEDEAAIEEAQEEAGAQE